MTVGMADCYLAYAYSLNFTAHRSLQSECRIRVSDFFQRRMVDQHQLWPNAAEMNFSFGKFADPADRLDHAIAKFLVPDLVADLIHRRTFLRIAGIQHLVHQRLQGPIVSA